MINVAIFDLLISELILFIQLFRPSARWRVWWTSVPSRLWRSSSFSLLCSSGSDSRELMPLKWVQMLKRMTGQDLKTSALSDSEKTWRPALTKGGESFCQTHVNYISFLDLFWHILLCCRKMLSLIQKNLPAVAAEMPLLLTSWLALIPFDDLPEFSCLTGVGAEHLIQSLLYRLRTCREKMDLNHCEVNVKVRRKYKIWVLMVKLYISNLCLIILSACSWLINLWATSSWRQINRRTGTEIFIRPSGFITLDCV